jgi:hypothetical protein
MAGLIIKEMKIRNQARRILIVAPGHLKDYPLFLPRHVTTVPFNLKKDSPNEQRLYNELSRYVNDQYNIALTRDKRRNVAFALVILQRRLASSTYALLRSLERRKNRLEELLKEASERFSGEAQRVLNRTRGLSFDFEAVEDMSEEERWQEEEIWETLSVAENREELEKEVQTIEGLIRQAREIIQGEEEIKIRALKRSLRELEQKFQDPEDKKILVFTESRDTLDYLEKKIRSWGYTTNTIHGGMRLEDRVKAESVFRNETQVMVATEAAGEGINLQFCHMMINYDIPWNPNRLEQRMGRIHRYGQTKEVYVYNLVAEDTREGRVLHKIFRKLDEIRNALGSDKVFDVIGEVLYGKNLSQLLTEAAAFARSIDEIIAEIDVEVDEAYIARVKENLGESLATRFIDYTRIKEMAQQAREHRLIPEYTESYFQRAFLRAGGRLRDRRDGFLSIESIPYDIRKIADDDLFKKSYGQLIRRYPKATFDKEIAFKNADAEFISFGHPLFEAVMSWVEGRFQSSLLGGSTFTDPDGRLDGHILFYEGEVRDGTGHVAGKRLFAFYVGGDEIRPVSPSIIWDLAEGGRRGDGAVDIEALKRRVSSHTISKLENYKEELLKERRRQAEIKEKYGIKSLDHLILKLDGDLIELYGRREQGENVDLVIRNKEERKKGYEKALDALKEQIEKEQSLTMSMPHFVGIIRVSPPVKRDDEMERDEEVERIGMEVAMEHERTQGRQPEDVSADDLGFDVRSTDPEGNVRYIEVKARAREGYVALTPNEWFKARRFRDDYFLYAVMNARSKPCLYIIRDPAESLEAEERVEVVRWVIPLKEITKKGERAIES